MAAGAPLPPNIRRDQKTVAAMLEIYCVDHHGARSRGLCPDCAALLSYARARLACCPFGAEKTTCRECPIHCYRADERAAMRNVMRYAGPRMLGRYPLLALRHLWLDHKPPPQRPAARPPRASS
jgi:hypothetical protein